MANAGQTIEDLLKAFDAQWRAGRPPSIDAVLREAADKSRGKLLVSLIDVDAKHRCSRGERVTIDQYRSRFPQLSTDRFKDTVDKLRARIETYQQRYDSRIDRADAAQTIAGDGALPPRGRGAGPTPDSDLDVTRPSSLTFNDPGSSVNETIDDSIDESQPRRYRGSSIASFDGNKPNDYGHDNASPGQPTASSSPNGGTPQRIGKYVVISEIDRGGQATVYRAAHPQLGTEVAIKIFHRACPESVEQLQSEGRALAQLKHEGIAGVYDLDLHEGRPYVVMEYLRGRNLAQYMADHELSPQDAAQLVAKVARALGAAHRLGLLHLDVKPHNILVGENGEPKLIDFGLAKFRQTAGVERAPTASITGTLLYMSPEQARGDGGAITARSDIFSLGCVLFQALTGEHPYNGQTATDVLREAQQGHIRGDLLDQYDLPPRLADACRRAIETEPRQRYNSADDFADDLEACLVEKSNTPLVIAGVALGAALLVLLGGIVVAVMSGDDADPDAANASTANGQAVASADPGAGVSLTSSSTTNGSADRTSPTSSNETPPDMVPLGPTNPGAGSTPVNNLTRQPTHQPPVANGPPANIAPIRVFVVDDAGSQEMRPGSMVDIGGNIRVEIADLPRPSAAAIIVLHPIGTAMIVERSAMDDTDTAVVFPAEDGYRIDRGYATWLVVGVGSTTDRLDAARIEKFVGQLGTLPALPQGYVLRMHGERVIAPREPVTAAEQAKVDEVTQALSKLQATIVEAMPHVSFSAVAFAPTDPQRTNTDARPEPPDDPRDGNNTQDPRFEPPDRDDTRFRPPDRPDDDRRPPLPRDGTRRPPPRQGGTRPSR